MAPPNFLPRGGFKRLVLGVLSLGLLVFSAPFAAIGVLSVILAPFCPPHNEDWVVRLVLTAVLEFFTAAFVASFVGLAWAIWTPAWVSRFASKVVAHSAAAIFIMYLVCSALWLLGMRR